MERIKKALELARQERQKKNASSSRLSSISESDVHGRRSIADQGFEYTETRSIGLTSEELREKRVIIDQQNVVSDAYKLLRTQVLQRLRENKWNALALVSPCSGEGKSLTAINLAISLAREVDYTVLLVDANLRSPKIQKYFDFDVEYGLSDYLCNDVPLNEILIHPEGIPRFVVLPAGRSLSNSSEMLSSPKMNELVEELKHRYPSRIVLFNLPPLLESSDALAFVPNCDAALMIIEEGKTKELELKQAVELLHGNELIGTVLNKAYTRDKDYGNMNVRPSFLSQLLTRLSRKSLPAWMGRK